MVYLPSSSVLRTQWLSAMHTHTHTHITIWKWAMKKKRTVVRYAKATRKLGNRKVSSPSNFVVFRCIQTKFTEIKTIHRHKSKQKFVSILPRDINWSIRSRKKSTQPTVSPITGWNNLEKWISGLTIFSDNVNFVSTWCFFFGIFFSKTFRKSRTNMTNRWIRFCVCCVCVCGMVKNTNLIEGCVNKTSGRRAYDLRNMAIFELFNIL